MSENANGTERVSLDDRIFAVKEISGMGRLATMRFLRGRFARAMNSLGHIFSYTSTRSYGCFFLSIGLFTLLLNLGEYYFSDVPTEALTSLIFGLAFSLLSVPFIIFDKPICIAFQDLRMTDFLFFEFFAIKRMHRTYSGRKIPPILGFFLGILPALLEFFTAPVVMTVILVTVIFTLVALTSPEFSMIVTLLLIPYISLVPSFEILISLLSALSFVSFMLKVIAGKRVLTLDIYSFILILIMIFGLIGGVINDGNASLFNSFFFIMVLLGYFPIANLIMNRRIADCAINAIVVSSVPVSIISVVEFTVESVRAGDISRSVSATFSSAAALSAFLITAAVFSLGFVISKRQRAKKAGYFVVFVLDLASLILNLNIWIGVAVLLTVAAFWLVRSKHMPIMLAFLLFAVAHLIFFIPTELGDKITAFIGIDRAFGTIVSDMELAFDVFLSNIWNGIGISNDGYTDIFGIGLAEKTNLLLGTALELGIGALILLVVFMILRLVHISRYRIYFLGSNVQPTARISTLAMLSILFFGVGEYIFSDMLILYLFVAVIAISSAALNVAKRETDDRLGYYSDARSSESSAIDISIY